MQIVNKGVFMMNTLISFKFEINISTLIAFIVGIFVGFILLALVYLLACLNSLRKKKRKINKQIEIISQEEIKNIIKSYQQSFNDEKKRRESIPVDYFKTSLMEMINDIAGQFYPKSKRPLMELSIEEIIMLDRYIIKKVEELFSHRGLSLFKNVKLSTIAKLIETKSTIDNNAVVKTAKRYRLRKIGNVILTGLNLINPYFWVKKLIINPSINLIIKKICITCYAIAGEETYNIYSKQIFMEDDEILKDIVSSINNEGSTLEKEGILIEQKHKKN